MKCFSFCFVLFLISFSFWQCNYFSQGRPPSNCFFNNKKKRGGNKRICQEIIFQVAATLSPNEILIDVTYFTLQFIYHSSSSILPVFVSSLLVMQSFATSVTVEGASTVDFGSTWGWRAASLITHSDPSKSGTLCRPVHRSTLVPGWDPDVGKRITQTTDASGDGITCWLEIGEERFWIGLFSVLLNIVIA